MCQLRQDNKECLHLDASPVPPSMFKPRSTPKSTKQDDLSRIPPVPDARTAYGDVPNASGSRYCLPAGAPELLLPLVIVNLATGFLGGWVLGLWLYKRTAARFVLFLAAPLAGLLCTTVVLHLFFLLEMTGTRMLGLSLDPSRILFQLAPLNLFLGALPSVFGAVAVVRRKELRDRD